MNRYDIYLKAEIVIHDIGADKLEEAVEKAKKIAAIDVTDQSYWEFIDYDARDSDGMEIHE